MGIEIRRADRSEASALTEIAHAAKRYWGYSEELIRLWSDGLTLTPQYVEQNEVYIALQGKRIVGVYALIGDGPERELEHFWIHPDFMAKGIGKRLFCHALEKATASGARNVKIVSDPNAEGFYLKMGARRAGEVPSMPEGRTLPLLVTDAED